MKKMRKHLFVLMFTMFTINGFCQISFERGYFIDNSGQRTDCLIKNIEWKNNPTEFQYKLNENESVQLASIEIVKEFGVFDNTRYIRADVEIDRSSESVEEISKNREPEFIKEQLLLKALVTGKANLYMYEDENLRRYFFKTSTNEIKQLIFKSYKISDSKIGQNNTFKGQLWNSFKDQNILMREVKKLNYTRKDLMKFFLKLNGYSHTQIEKYTKRVKKDFINLSIRPGITYSNFSMDNKTSRIQDMNLDNKLGLRLGIEAEYVMPFNKNKWSFLVEPTYQYYKAEKTVLYQETELISRELLFKVDYKSIEIPVGIRHYLFLNKRSKMFVNASFVFDLSLSGSVSVERFGYTDLIDFDIRTSNNLVFGLGYNWNNKHSFEFRYGTNRNLLSKYVSWSSDFKTLSFIYGFNIF